jgi:hypothetical protein
MLHSIPPALWGRSLSDFSSRNSGRRTRVDVDDLDLGTDRVPEEHSLLRVAFDKSDDRIDIVLGSVPHGGRFLSRSIAAARSVDILTDRHGRDKALRIEHGRSQTVLMFVE